MAAPLLPRTLWYLRPDVTYLNHGAFGATPRSVVQERFALMVRGEEEPIDFYSQARQELLPAARQRAERFLRAPEGSLVFVPNVTAGLSTVLHAVDLGPGDEVVLTDHAYPAARLAVQRACERRKSRLVTISIGLPDGERDIRVWKDRLLSRLTEALHESTKLLIVDHVTSPTACVLPIHELADLSRRRSLTFCLDAAHAPGQLPSPCDGVGADFWVGNLHKWAFAPKSVGVLVVAENWRDRIFPLITGNAANQGFHNEFDEQGTLDLSAYLAVPSALDFPGRHLERGWEELRASNAKLAHDAADLVSDRGFTVFPPTDPNLSMVLMELPPGWISSHQEALALQTLLRQHFVEVPTVWWNGRAFLRLSTQAYNSEADYVRLLDVLDFTEFRKAVSSFSAGRSSSLA